MDLKELFSDSELGALGVTVKVGGAKLTAAQRVAITAAIRKAKLAKTAAQKLQILAKAKPKNLSAAQYKQVLLALEPKPKPKPAPKKPPPRPKPKPATAKASVSLKGKLKTGISVGSKLKAKKAVPAKKPPTTTVSPFKVASVLRKAAKPAPKPVTKPTPTPKPILPFTLSGKTVQPKTVPLTVASKAMLTRAVKSARPVVIPKKVQAVIGPPPVVPAPIVASSGPALAAQCPGAYRLVAANAGVGGEAAMRILTEVRNMVQRMETRQLATSEHDAINNTAAFRRAVLSGLRGRLRACS